MIQYQLGADGIANLVIDMPDKPVNMLNKAFQKEFIANVNRLVQDRDKILGIIIASNKPSYFVGSDFDELRHYNAGQTTECMRTMQEYSLALRCLETIGRPVVAVIHGTAIGAGLELTLACHFRICLNNSAIQLGFPEVTLGVIPGAGGIARSVRLIGIQAAMPFLIMGQKLSPQEAFNCGLIHALAQNLDELYQRAVKWIFTEGINLQPWDNKEYRIPGGGVNYPPVLQLIQTAPAIVREHTKGNFPAPEAILCAIVEGAQVNIEHALLIDCRYFTQVVTGQVAKNMISTMHFQMHEVNACTHRPTDVPETKTTKVGILGAGIIGAGVAWSNAASSVHCVLKDLTLTDGEKGKDYTRKLLNELQLQQKLSTNDAEETAKHIRVTDKAENLQECDLIIEAVTENFETKTQALLEIAPFLGPETIVASSTSTLSIDKLAQSFTDPSRFIGIHFFAPVEKMKLVEIVKGAQTSDKTLAKAFDYVRRIGKMPIFVNAGKSLYVPRIFAAFINEGVIMLGEGTAPAMIENAALTVGMTAGPLTIQDEVGLDLSLTFDRQAKERAQAEGLPYQSPGSIAIIERMVHEFKRTGKSAGAGFYDYNKPDSDKKSEKKAEKKALKAGEKIDKTETSAPKKANSQIEKIGLWPELSRIFNNPGVKIPYKDLLDRILFIQSIEAIRCLEEHIIVSTSDANIGSIFGLGFPSWTGGTIQFVNHVGVKTFAKRAEQLRQRYGERFTPPALLLEHAEKGLDF